MHVRKVIAVALALAVQTTGLTAPFVHAHPDDHTTDHHDGHAIHAHAAGHAPAHDPTNAPSLGAEDHDRAVYVNAFVAVAVASFSAPEVELTTFELAAPVERAAYRPVEILRTHDPPALTSVPSRAPPLSLS